MTKRENAISVNSVNPVIIVIFATTAMLDYITLISFSFRSSVVLSFRGSGVLIFHS